MMTFSQALITLGAAIIVLGLVLRYAPWLVSWFGNLPGDISIQQANSRVFIPITSMLVVSLVLSWLINMVFRK
jgi:hypothetical protein